MHMVIQSIESDFQYIFIIIFSLYHSFLNIFIIIMFQGSAYSKTSTLLGSPWPRGYRLRFNSVADCEKETQEESSDSFFQILHLWSYLEFVLFFDDKTTF